jgi:hypothetical protein
VVIAVDEIVRKILVEHDAMQRDFDDWQARRQQYSVPEPEPPAVPAAPTVTHAQLQRALEDLTDVVADETSRVDAALMKRIERLERFEEIQQLKMENEELRKKAAQLERRVVFVDLSKTHATASDDDVVVDLDEARAATRGSRDAA